MKTNSLIFCFIICLLNASQSQEDVRGKWRPRTVRIDGKAKDWGNPLRLYHAETGLFFDIENDSNTLYICFQCKDPATQIKINKAGMKLEIKAKGTTKRNASIDFPLTGKKEINVDDNNKPEQTQNIDFLKHGFMLQNVDLLAEGFASQNGMILLTDTSGIRAAIDWDKDNVMTYELSIPLSELFGTDFSLADAKKAQMLKVEIKSFNKPESSNPDDSPASGGGGIGMSGGARSGVGSMSGGGGSLNGGGLQGSQNRNTNDKMLDSKKMKQGFYLAQSR